MDYFELRHDWGSESVGERCGGAADAAACEAAFAALTAPPDAWAMGTGGGIPAPLFYILYTRGDEVGVVGRSDLEAFLLPTDDVYDAAFLAQVATLGSVDCSAASARAVPGGHEVVTRRSETCGGGVIDFRVFVGEDGVTTIVEQVQVTPAEDVICP